jgi:hypothetical protein
MTYDPIAECRTCGGSFWLRELNAYSRCRECSDKATAALWSKAASAYRAGDLYAEDHFARMALDIERALTPGPDHG